jgi:CubicO group peptidase (beta-lactamase class C family)
MRLKTVTEFIFIVLITAGSAVAQSGPIPLTTADKHLAGLVHGSDGPAMESSPGDRREKKKGPGIHEELDRYLDELVKADKFAGAVLIAKDGHPIFRKAYGLASREYGVPNRPDTKFNLGSINKIFTQIAIGQLIEQGQLSLDDTIGTILPDYPNQQARERVTVRHLLAMTSGIGDFFNEKFRATAKDRLRTIADFLPLFASEPLAFEPGTGRLYSNGGYVVLGAIIEKVSGRTYYDYVHEYIFKPIGMEHTVYYQADDIVPNRASGYTRPGWDSGEASSADLPLTNNFYLHAARGTSAGGGYSTADDLLKFALALESGELRLPNFETPPSPQPGTGQPPQGGSRVIGGGAAGVNTALSMNVAGVYTVIVLANLDPPSAQTVAEQINAWLITGQD